MKHQSEKEEKIYAEVIMYIFLRYRNQFRLENQVNFIVNFFYFVKNINYKLIELYFIKSK